MSVYLQPYYPCLQANEVSCSNSKFIAIIIIVAELISFPLLLKSNRHLLQPEGPYLKTPGALTALFHYTLLSRLEPVSFVFHNNWVPPQRGRGRHSNEAQKPLDVISVTVPYWCCSSPHFYFFSASFFFLMSSARWVPDGLSHLFPPEFLLCATKRRNLCTSVAKLDKYAVSSLQCTQKKHVVAGLVFLNDIVLCRQSLSNQWRLCWRHILCSRGTEANWRSRWVQVQKHYYGLKGQRKRKLDVLLVVRCRLCTSLCSSPGNFWLGLFVWFVCLFLPFPLPAASVVGGLFFIFFIWPPGQLQSDWTSGAHIC